jgi:hypothetical protein
MESQLTKRIKSFAWRFMMAVIAFGITWLADNIGLMEFSPQVTVVLGLILGEISKYLNR